MLTGGAATQQCFQLSSSFGGVLPSDLDGATAPPAGSGFQSLAKDHSVESAPFFQASLRTFQV